jgi:cupin fold WbuC family metalloprotein
MNDAPPAPVLFGRASLDTLTAAASASPRKRKNLNFHVELSDPAQRLLNAVEPDSYIRPHRHRDPLRDETFVVVRGAFGLVLFDEAGAVSQTALLRAHGDLIGAHVPPNAFHSLVSLETGSIFFEAKAGPYVALSDKDFAPWAPPEGHPNVPAFLAKMRALFSAG